MSLKEKAKTTREIEVLSLQISDAQNILGESNPNAFEDKWVLLSDAEAEIEQLKNEHAIDIGVMCYDCKKCRVIQLEKQIEAAKTILENYEININNTESYTLRKLIREVLGETTK